MFTRSRTHTMLDDLPMFSKTDHRSRLIAARLFTEIHVDSGHVLVRQGQPGREFFVIVSGHADVSRDGETVAELGPNDFFGEMALITREFRNAAVVAKEPMRLLAANRREFESLMRLDPSFESQICAAAENRAA